MSIVTINGQRGSGAPEIGAEVAGRLKYAYVDRQVLGEAARRLGTTEEALEELEESALTGPRILRMLSRILSRIGTTGAANDQIAPFGLGQDYNELMIEGAASLDDERFLEVTMAVVKDIAEAGDAVIVGRGSNIILKDHPDTLHVGLVSEMSSRVSVVAHREGLSMDEAEKFTARAEQSRSEYFRKYFSVEADGPANFHLMLNTHLLDTARAVDLIVRSLQPSA